MGRRAVATLEVQRGDKALLVRLMTRVHDKSPADRPLAWGMLVMVLRRKRLAVVGRILATANHTQIYARIRRSCSRLVILVEFVRVRERDIVLMLVGCHGHLLATSTNSERVLLAPYDPSA